MLISCADLSGDGHSKLPSTSSPHPSIDKSSDSCHSRPPYRKALISSLITTELFEGLHLTASSTTWLCSTKLQAAPYGPPITTVLFSITPPPPKKTPTSSTLKPPRLLVMPWDLGFLHNTRTLSQSQPRQTPSNVSPEHLHPLHPCGTLGAEPAAAGMQKPSPPAELPASSLCSCRLTSASSLANCPRALSLSCPTVQLSWAVGNLSFGNAAFTLMQPGRHSFSGVAVKGERRNIQPGLWADPCQGCGQVQPPWAVTLPLSSPPPLVPSHCSLLAIPPPVPRAIRLPPPSGLHLGELMFFTGL